MQDTCSIFTDSHGIEQKNTSYPKHFSSTLKKLKGCYHIVGTIKFDVSWRGENIVLKAIEYWSKACLLGKNSHTKLNLPKRIPLNFFVFCFTILTSPHLGNCKRGLCRDHWSHGWCWSGFCKVNLAITRCHHSLKWWSN